MRSRLKQPSRHDLRGLAQLKGEHVCRNGDFRAFAGPVLREESSIGLLALGMFAFLIQVYGGGQCCQRTVIIVPAAPIVFDILLDFEWEVMQQSANVPDPLLNNFLELVFGIGRTRFMG